MQLSAAAIAYEALHRGMIEGRYPPGSWVRESDVARAIGVSRTPVREALNRLQAEGLVRIHPHRGAVVVGWTARDLDDIFELRVLVEGYGARRVAQHPPPDVTGLLDLCDQMDQLLEDDRPEHREAMSQLAVDFHALLHELTGNRLLVSMLPSLVGAPFVREAFDHHTHDDLARAFAQHRELVEAVLAGDGEWAQAIMVAHLRAGRRSLQPMEKRDS
jgi:DNA-binding GntR family transcriptional regulator